MDETIQVGEGGRKSKLPRWPFSVGLAVAFALAIGAGAFVRWLSTRSVVKDHGSSIRLPGTVEDVQNLRVTGNPEEASKKLDAALADSKTSTKEKYLLYIQKGNIATDAKKYEDAITLYLKAADLSMTYEVAALLGDTYAQANDPANAIIWYQKAIPLIPQQNNPLRNDDKKTLQDKITALGGQP